MNQLLNAVELLGYAGIVVGLLGLAITAGR